MKTSIRLFPTVAAFLCLTAVGPKAQAVVPAPDGGYPGGNTAEGQAALLSLSTGGYNTGVGFFSLRSNTTNSFNTAIGAGTLLASTADQNTAAGAGALLNNTIGAQNTANGAFALFSNTEGSFNVASGDQALFKNTMGTDNTAIGATALYSNTIGLGNTAIGNDALVSNTIGSNNIAVGANTGANVTTASSVICIGAAGNNVDNSCYIGNIFSATSSNGMAVFINSNGRLGTTTSSRRFKDDVKPMDKASEELFALQPVTFRYKKEVDPEGPQDKSQFGLVAEDVERVNADLVVRDKEGKPYSVRYDQVNAMLLNEFLKEHRKVQKLEAALEAVNARLKAQDVKIQRVSRQIDLSESSSRVAVTSH